MVEKFLLVGLKANLPETRDPNKLYFCSDTRELFKGNDLYTDAVRIVDALPADMAQGVLYILPSGEVKSFNGTDVITVAKPYVTSTAGTLSAANTDDQVPTAKVVYDSIVEAVGAVVDGGELVNNVISTKAGTITVAKGAYTQLTGEAVFSEGTNYFTKVGESYVVDQTVTAENFAGKVEAGLFVSSDETDVALKGVVVNPSYDATTRTITLPYADGTESLVIGLGKDIFIDPTAENKYNAETGKIEIFLNDGNEETGATKLEIPASELVDIYTGAVSADGSATVAVSEDNKITASVNVSAEAGNGLSKKADGLFVDTTSAADFKAFKDSVDASLDDIDTQLNGEEIVLKEAGVAAEVEYAFDANDTFVVDGVETEVADQSALDAMVADGAVSDVVVMVDGTEDRIAANAAAVARAQAGVDANAEAIAANNEAIAALEAKNDVHVDATADNKFNDATGKIELFLNDESEGYEPIAKQINIEYNGSTYGVAIKIAGNTTPENSPVSGAYSSYDVYADSNLNILSDVTAENYEQKIAEGLYVLYNQAFVGPAGVTMLTSAIRAFGYADTALYQLNNGNYVEIPGTINVDYVDGKPVESTNGSGFDIDGVEFVITNDINKLFELAVVGTVQTKVEVDMSGLTSKVAANTEAIASNKTEAKNYADGLNTAMDARVTVVEEKTQANEDAIAALEAKKDLRLDETADNKYNAETDKVELFLNDGGKVVEVYKELEVVQSGNYKYIKLVQDPELNFSSNITFFVFDGESYVADQTVTADNFVGKVEAGLYISSTDFNFNLQALYNGGPFYKYYSEDNIQQIFFIPGEETGILEGNCTLCRLQTEVEPSTKVEVDMSQLTNIINSNNQSNTESIEALEEAIQWGTF